MDFIYGFFPKLKNYGDTYYWNDLLLNKIWSDYLVIASFIVFTCLFLFYSVGKPNLNAKKIFWAIVLSLSLIVPLILLVLINREIIQLSNEGTFPTSLKFYVFFLGLIDVLILIVIFLLLIWFIIWSANKAKFKFFLRGMSLYPFPIPFLKKKLEA